MMYPGRGSVAPADPSDNAAAAAALAAEVTKENKENKINTEGAMLEVKNTLDKIGLSLERCITSFDEIKGGDLKTLDAVVKQIDKLPADAKILTRGDAAVEDEIWDAAGDVELHTSEAIGRKPGRRPSPSGVRKGGKSPSSKQSSKAAAAEAAGRAYTHKQALAHGVKDGCIDSSMSSGAAASMVM